MVASVIELQRVGFGYRERAEEIFKDVDLVCRTGEITLVCGATGSGKSTLLNLMAGLVPRFTGGSLTGKILVDGVDLFESLASQRPRLVGYVSQQSEGSFVAETVEEELAFTLEQLGVPADQMRAEVQSTADLLGMAGLLTRPVEALSGGQQQRLAIGAAVIAKPRVLLLDEPTSELDDAGARTLIELLSDLANELGIAVVIAEHHLERLIHVCERIVIVGQDGKVSAHDRDSGAAEAAALGLMPRRDSEASRSGLIREQQAPGWHRSAAHEIPAIKVEELAVGYGGEAVIQDLSFEIAPGQALGLVGPNGSGKTTVLLTLAGELQAKAGSILINGQTRLVPQNASDLLYLDSVAAELATTSQGLAQPTGDRRLANLLLGQWIGPVGGNTHPRDLSSGQQLALALAIQLSSGADILLLDEPTRGLDHRAKTKLAATLNELQSAGKALVIASHDLDFLDIVNARLVRLGA